MIRTSARTTRTSRKAARTKKSGFSLIEILMVIGLMAFVMTIAIPNAGMALKMNITNSTRELATVIRSAHDEAVLKGEIYRVALDLDKGEYWVEHSEERDFLMRTAAQEEEEDRRKAKLSREEKEKLKDPFSLAQSVTKKKLKLKSGVKFSEAITARAKDPIKGGMAYAYVFPHGYVEKIIVHLKDSLDRENTLITNSVTGKSRVFERYFKEGE